MNESRKYTVEEQKQLISDEAVHKAFLEREDIKDLPPEEQETKWQKHLEGLNWFREKLANLPGIVVEGDLHAQEAAKLYELKEEEVTKEQRNIAQQVNFGFLYGGKPVRPLEEGSENKGGQNPPNTSSKRPPLPQGSGGKPTGFPFDGQGENQGDLH